MGGGIIQLVAIGAQDKKLIGDPKTNFFKSVYSHYYNFSMESVQQYFKGGTDFNKRCSVNIRRVGDLVTKCYLECTIDNLCYGFATNIDCITSHKTSNQKITDCFARFTSNLATAIINKVELEIGGQIIDSHTGTWMETWNELSAGNNGLSFPYYGNLECDDELNIDLNTLMENAKEQSIQGFFHADIGCPPDTILSLTELEPYVSHYITLPKKSLCNYLDYLYYHILHNPNSKIPVPVDDNCEHITNLNHLDCESETLYDDLNKCISDAIDASDFNTLENLYLILSLVKIINGYSCMNDCSTEAAQIKNTQRTIYILYIYCEKIPDNPHPELCSILESLWITNIYFLKQILSGYMTLESYIYKIVLLDLGGKQELAEKILKIIFCMLDVNNCNPGCSCCIGDSSEYSECAHCSPPTPNKFELDRGNIYINDDPANFTYLTAGVGGGFVMAFDSYQLCRMNGKKYWSFKTPFYVPFNFWFNRDIGSALPIIALQYHEVYFNITFQDYKYIGNNQYVFSEQTQPKLNATIWVDYIFLDTDIRRKFAQEKHEYIIDQVQFNEFSGGNNNLELNFNHPIKFLTWIGSPYKIPIIEQGYEFTSIGPSTPTSFIKECKNTHFDYSDVLIYMDKMKNICNVKIELKLNGHNRFEQRNARYFTRKTKIDSNEIIGNPYLLLNRDSGLFKGANNVTNNTLIHATNDAYAIGYYPFCLPGYALGLTPAGTCNFSRLNNAELVFRNPVDTDFLLGPIIVYAMNYNFLKIESGMAGLEFSN